MAILGNTTLISGRCYGNFINDGKLLIGTSSELSSIPTVTSSDSNPLQVNGYAVAKGFKIPNGGGDQLLCADGTTLGTDELPVILDGCGDVDVPIYIREQGEIAECNTFKTDSKTSRLNAGAATGAILVAKKNNQALLPGHLMLYEDTNRQNQIAYCCLDVSGTDSNQDATDWTITFSDGNQYGTVKMSLNGGFFQTSDIRKKTNLKDLDLDKCYDLIDKCQTVLFDYKEGAKDQMGMIAQEVEEFFPEIVSTDADGFKSLDYAKLTVVILRVLKDLIKKVN